MRIKFLFLLVVLCTYGVVQSCLAEKIKVTLYIESEPARKDKYDLFPKAGCRSAKGFCIEIHIPPLTPPTAPHRTLMEIDPTANTITFEIDQTVDTDYWTAHINNGIVTIDNNVLLNPDFVESTYGTRNWMVMPAGSYICTIVDGVIQFTAPIANEE
jgi:hypothetical protein